MTPPTVDTGLVLALVPVVVALVQAAKALRLPPALAPAANLVGGIAVVALWTAGPWRDVSFAGVIVGLTAGGFYSGITSTRSSLASARYTRKSSSYTSSSSSSAAEPDDTLR